MTDKYDEMAAIAGKAGGLDEKQWPGLAIILRGVRAEAIEQAAKVAEQKAIEYMSPEYATGQPLSSFNERFACGQIAEAIRSLLAPPLQAGE